MTSKVPIFPGFIPDIKYRAVCALAPIKSCVAATQHLIYCGKSQAYSPTTWYIPHDTIISESEAAELDLVPRNAEERVLYERASAIVPCIRHCTDVRRIPSLCSLGMLAHDIYKTAYSTFDVTAQSLVWKLQMELVHERKGIDNHTTAEIELAFNITLGVLLACRHSSMEFLLPVSGCNGGQVVYPLGKKIDGVRLQSLDYPIDLICMSFLLCLPFSVFYSYTGWTNDAMDAIWPENAGVVMVEGSATTGSYLPPLGRYSLFLSLSQTLTLCSDMPSVIGCHSGQ